MQNIYQTDAFVNPRCFLEYAWDNRYMLRLFETQDLSVLGYEFWDSGKLIFSGNDFDLMGGENCYSDSCIFGLLDILALSYSDIHADYFSDYTPDQLMWLGESVQDLKHSIHNLKQNGINDDHIKVRAISLLRKSPKQNS